MLSALLIFSACGESDGRLRVRIGCFPNITHSQALYSMAEESFKKALGEDCNVSYMTFTAGPSEIEAFFAGELDIGYIGPIPAINGYARSGGEIVVIAGATDAGAILVSRKDLILNDISELSGKKIAIPQYGNTQDLVLRSLLNDAGLKDTTKNGDVEIIQSDNPSIKLLLDRGDIDAALVPEPWGSRLEKESEANVFLEYNEVFGSGNYTSAVVVVRREFLEENPDIVKKFLEEHIRLTDYINENKEEVTNVINSQIKSLTQNDLPEDILKAAYKRLNVTINPQTKSLETFIKLYQELGYIKEEINFLDFIDMSILNKILEEKGFSLIE